MLAAADQVFLLVEIGSERCAYYLSFWLVALAGDLLLDDHLTLEDICEELHAKGYRYRSGRPFVEFKKTGQRKPNTNTLSAIFHNWAYAGWLTSKAGKVLPKTIRGDWEPIVTTEEFERGLSILNKRNQHRVVRRKHDYLLKGFIYYEHHKTKAMEKLTGSTSNASRSGGGTSYYCIPRSNINFPCIDIDGQIPDLVMNIQVNPDFIPAIRDLYMKDIVGVLKHIHPDERGRLEGLLKSIDEEETRMARIFAAGKITEGIWESLWYEWQDRRNKIRSTLESMKYQHDTHITNLDVALGIITQVGVVYNTLERSDQKELLHQMVERVTVNSAGKAKLKLRAPFAYLSGISKQVSHNGGVSGVSGVERSLETKIGRVTSTDLSEAQCSDWVLCCGKDKTLSEHSSAENPLDFLQLIAFPQRAQLARFTDPL